MTPDAHQRERLEAYEERNVLYRGLGLDRTQAARWVLDQAGLLAGPALDIGTGKGTLAIELARNGLDVVSVDLDAEEQAMAALLADQAGVGSRIRFLQGDASRLPFPDAHFGCAAMMNVLHHLDSPGPIMREMARSVRPGGRILLADFNERGFEVIHRVHQDEGRVHPRSPVTVETAGDELIGCGFRMVKMAEGHFHHAVLLLNPERSE